MPPNSRPGPVRAQRDVGHAPRGSVRGSSSRFSSSPARSLRRTVPAVGVDPALVLRVDVQRRLQVCARSRVRVGAGFQVVGVGSASNFFSKTERGGFGFGFLLVSRGRVRTHREEEGESAAGVLAGLRSARAASSGGGTAPVLCASAMIWLKSTSKSPSSVSLAPVEVTALVRAWTAPACLWRGADLAAVAVTSVGGQSYSVQSASEVLTIARSGGGALDARIGASVRRDEAGGRRCLLAAACVSGRFWGFKFEPSSLERREYRQPRVTRFESFRGFERRKPGRLPFELFWQFCFARLQGSGSSSFLDVARTAPAHPRARR